MMAVMVVSRAAGAAVLAGAVVMLTALVSAPGPWVQGYVSEAGSAGQPLASAYRAGLTVLAVGVALLGPGLVRHARAGVPRAGLDPHPTDRPGGPAVSSRPGGRRAGPGVLSSRPGRRRAGPAAVTSGPGRPPAGPAVVSRPGGRSMRLAGFLAEVRARPNVRSARLAAVLLAASAVMAATSGAVSCSNQCPLPPFEPTTAADVIHTAASIVGMVLLAAAMAAVALADGLRPALRRLAAVALAATVPLGGTLGLIMLFVGRGPTGAILERVLLVVAVSWLVGTSVVAGLPRGDRRSQRA
jgi:hypothetical protein